MSGLEPRRKASSRNRHSLFARNSFSAFSLLNEGEKDREATTTLRKRRTLSTLGSLSLPTHPFRSATINGDGVSTSHWNSPAATQGVKRPTSLLGSKKTARYVKDDFEEAYAAASKISVSSYSEMRSEVDVNPRNILCHGEVQISSSKFRKKRDYLVLTNSNIVRFKTLQKAAENFPELVSSPMGPEPVSRHQSLPSVKSKLDFQPIPSEASGEQGLRIPLKQVVAVYRLDDGRPYFSIEVVYLDDDVNQASTMTLQLGDPEERDVWLASIRKASNRARVLDSNPISPYNSHLAARLVEREQDYDPSRYAIYKVVLRPHAKLYSRGSSDDLTKVGSTVCFLVVGIHKVHILPLFKSMSRGGSSLTLGSYNTQCSYGLLSITCLQLNVIDDSLEIWFRLPLQRPKKLFLASLASSDIALRIQSVDRILRPEWQTRPYRISFPDDLEHWLHESRPSPSLEASDSLDKTLVAYCMAYEVNPGNIRYEISYEGEDSPRFQLLGPADHRRKGYNLFELLAILRSLRYNEFFKTVSFANINLDILNGQFDIFGNEHVCDRNKAGTPVSLPTEELQKSCLLVQELRALAITSKTLRRMDFTSCINRKPQDSMIDGDSNRDMGCGIVEALFPLCRHQDTNIDWIILNNIELGDTDLDYLVAAAVERDCHFRAIEMSRCGLNDRSLGLTLEALRAQDNTLESIDISANVARLHPSIFDGQISVFGFIRKLNLSNLSRTAVSEPLLTSETLLSWKLEELSLSGTPLNSYTLDSIASYLISRQSDTLRELNLDSTKLTGGDVSFLMHAMVQDGFRPRNLHLNISQNPLGKDHRKLVNAIAEDLAPASLTMRMIEHDSEITFRDLIIALSKNKSIKYLDISRHSLPCDATEQTCEALARMFNKNKHLEYLDISGEDSRLEISRLGVGINQALNGLKTNKTLTILRINCQKLGFQGAATLADVLKNNSTLCEVHCEDNEIPLSGYTDIINSLHGNTRIQYLSSMEASHREALKQTEQEVKRLREEPSVNQFNRVSSMRNIISAKVGARSNMQRTSSTYLSDQDINAALRLVNESWDRQIYRLGQYLHRNYCIANGIPTTLEVDEEDYERPDSASSLSKAIERVRYDTTPTAEREAFISDEDLDEDDDGLQLRTR